MRLGPLLTASNSLWFSLSALVLSVTAKNVTIDDQLGRIAYDPPAAWIAGQSCTGTCAVNDSLQSNPLVFNGTWTQGVFNPNPGAAPISATLNFTGESLPAFFRLRLS